MKILLAIVLLSSLPIAAAHAASDRDAKELLRDTRETAALQWRSAEHPSDGTPGSREIDPDADLLIVIDSPLVSYLYDQLEAAVAASDYAFAFWNVSVDGPLPDGMLEDEWTAVILFADNTGPMPTRAYAPGSSPWVDFVIDGGSLFYVDQDYFWANGEELQPVFAAGDFAWDAFGIASGSNDGNTIDSWTGVAEDPISGDFSDDPYWTNSLLTFNWEDLAYPVPEGSEIFHGPSPSQCGGIRYENDFGGRMHYLSFNALTAATGSYPSFTLTGQFAVLLDNIAAWYSEPALATLDLFAQTSEVPAEGGTIVYDVHFVNNTALTVPGATFWTSVTMPNGQQFGPLFQQSFTVTPFMDLFVTGLGQSVPLFAPPGDYTFTGHAGFYPNPLLIDDFSFEKLPAAAQGQPAHTWSTSGTWPQAVAGEAAAPRAGGYKLDGAWPNPFNPSTSLSVTLPEPAGLTVTVHNTAGRRVAVLADGSFNAGTHRFNFDGSRLASGVYFVRATVPERLDQTSRLLLVR